MRSAKSWRSLLLILVFIGMSLPLKGFSDVEIKVAHIKDDKADMSLHFPRPFDENEMLLNTLLYNIILSRMPEDLQETLVFDQKGTSLHFSGGLEAMALLQEKVIEIMVNGVEESEFLEQKELVLEAEWVELDDLNRWIEMASPIASFAADFYLSSLPDTDTFSFAQTDLDESRAQLTLTQGEGTHHFHALRLTPDDCHNISKLIKNMADLSLWELLKKSKEMKKLGKKIEPVHPLRFLGYIFSTHELKKRMSQIKESHFKWNKFTEGLFERLSKEARHDNINRFIPGFAQVLGSSEAAIEDFARRHDWSGMLDYLM